MTPSWHRRAVGLDDALDASPAMKSHGIVLAFFLIALIVGITMLIVSSVTLRAKTARTAGLGQTLTSGAIVALGLLFAYLHAFPIRQKAGETYPVIDSTVFWSIVCILVAFLLPKVTHLTIFGAEIDLQEAVGDLADNVQKTSDLFERFMSRLGIVLGRMAAEADQDARDEMLVEFIADRLADAKVYVLESASVELRLSVWLTDGFDLMFYVSNEISDAATIGKTFGPNEGILGRAFAEQKTWNVGDAAKSPAYTVVRHDVPPRYGAILVAPISLPNTPLGVLSVDKNKNDPFSLGAQRVLEGLASTLAIAINARRLMNAPPVPRTRIRRLHKAEVLK